MPVTCTPSASNVRVPSWGSTSTRTCSLVMTEPFARTEPSGPAPSAARKVRHPKPGTSLAANTTSRTGARRWRIEIVAPWSPSATSCSRVASRSMEASPGPASWKVTSTVPSASRWCSTRAMRAPASSGPRIISTTQRIFRPTTTADIPSPPVVLTTWLGHAEPLRATRCTGPSPGNGTVDQSAAGDRGGIDDDGRSRRRVHLGRELVQCVARQRGPDVARLLVAHPHRFDHFVVAARARRVVRAVEHEVAPRCAGTRRDSDRRGGGARSTARRPVRRRARPRRRSGARRPGSMPRP